MVAMAIETIIRTMAASLFWDLFNAVAHIVYRVARWLQGEKP